MMTMDNLINTEEAVVSSKRKRGRPPAYNQEEALDKALKVFWSQGYEGTSLADLTQALGINKPSLYATFGNKEALFRQVVERYVAKPAAFVTEALAEPTALQVATKFLNQAAEFLTHCEHPHGCLIIQSALTCGQDAATMQQLLINYRIQYESALRLRFEQAKSQGDLPKEINAANLAKYIATIHQGMSVQASTGATLAELEEMVAFALKSWPELESGA